VTSGKDGQDGFGTALAGDTDLNGDGWPELAIASPYSVSAHGGWGRIDILAAPGSTLLDQLCGFFEPSLARFGGPLGTSIAFAPDLDGDGADELIAGTYWGGVAVFWGGSSLRQERLELSALGEEWSLTHELGASCAAVGDADSDGRLDLLLGCRADWPRTESTRMHPTLVSGCDLGELAYLAPDGQQTCVAGRRNAPWDVLIGFPAKERAYLVRERLDWSAWFGDAGFPRGPRAETRLEDSPGRRGRWSSEGARVRRRIRRTRKCGLRALT
jgi:hypothetical protein